MNFKKAFKISMIFGLMLIMVMSVIGASRGGSCSTSATCDYGYNCIASTCKPAAALGCGSDLGCANVKKAADHEAKCINGKCKYQYKTTPGVQHAGGELVGGEDIMVTTSTGDSGTLGSLLGSLFANMNSGIANLGDATKMTIAKISFGGLSKTYNSIDTAVKTDAATNNYVKKSFVQQALYARESEISDYSSISLNTVKTGVCTLVGLREIGVKDVYGYNTCSGDLAEYDKVIVQVGDDAWITPAGGTESNVRSTGTAGFGLVYCCLPRGTVVPEMTKMSGVSQAARIGVKSMKETPINYCYVSIYKANNAKIKGPYKVTPVITDDVAFCYPGKVSSWENCMYLDVAPYLDKKDGSMCKYAQYGVKCVAKNAASGKEYTTDEWMTPYDSTTDDGIWYLPSKSEEDLFDC